MGHLIFHRAYKKAVATDAYITIDNLPRCILRVINMNDAQTACRWGIGIADRNTTEGTVETISLVNDEYQVEINKDLGWEGYIELALHQKLIAYIFNCAVNDDLRVTVGYELIP